MTVMATLTDGFMLIGGCAVAWCCAWLYVKLVQRFPTLDHVTPQEQERHERQHSSWTGWL